MKRNIPAIVGFILSLAAVILAFIAGTASYVGFLRAFLSVGFATLAAVGLLLGVIGAIIAKRPNGTGQGYAALAIILAIVSGVAYSAGVMVAGTLNT